MIWSPPPLPSMMSSPDPDDDRSVCRPCEPVTVNAVVATEALRFSKFVTTTLSPVVWSVPAATEKFTAVMPPSAARMSVSVPAAAVDRSFRAAIDDAVAAAAGR